MAGRQVKVRPIRNTNRTVIADPTDGIPIDDMKLESNAFSDKTIISSEPIPFKKEVGKKRIRRRKKSFLSGLGDLFFGEDAKAVADFIIHDVLIPAAKSTIIDMVSGGAERLFYGESGASDRLRRDKGRSIVSYGAYYKDRQKPGHTRRERGRAVDEIILDTRAEANEILQDMLAALEEYDQVSVADFYDLVGITSNDFTNQNYGWTNLRSATVDRVRDGYLLNLPRTVVLD